MTIIELRDRVIEDGVASVHRHETRPSHVRGGVAGFALCRMLATPEAFHNVIEAMERACFMLQDEFHSSRKTLSEEEQQQCIDAYWEHRMAQLQVEFCYGVLKVAWGIYPHNLSHVRKYAEIVGVAYHA